MRRILKAILFVALVFSATWLCYSCSNDNSKRAIHDEEKVDTCNCSTLVSMNEPEGNSWTFRTKRRLGIRNPSKPTLLVEMIKEKKNVDSSTTDIIISLKINSAICVDEGSHIDFVFTDSSSFDLINLYGNNCHGDFSASLLQELNDIPGVRNAVDIKKLCGGRVSYIRFATHDGYSVYALSEIESTNFQHLFNCLYQAK